MNKINVKARQKARRFAVQALYQWQFNQDSAAEIEAEFRADHLMDKVDTVYFSELIRGVLHDLPAIDVLLQSALDRPLTELTPIELSVLRLAVYELQHRLDVPYRVIIDEALELTKTFGAQEGYKYVNGVLDRLARQLRDKEIKPLSS